MRALSGAQSVEEPDNSICRETIGRGAEPRAASIDRPRLQRMRVATPALRWFCWARVSLGGNRPWSPWRTPRRRPLRGSATCWNRRTSVLIKLQLPTATRYFETSVLYRLKEFLNCDSEKIHALKQLWGDVVEKNFRLLKYKQSIFSARCIW